MQRTAGRPERPGTLPLPAAVIDCDHYDGERCTVSGVSVSPKLCDSCLAASSGNPDPENPNWFLASSILLGYSIGKHKNQALAQKAQEAVYAAQCRFNGRDAVKVMGKLPPSPAKTVTPCIHLGKPIRKAGCGCWQKTEHECKAKGGLHVIPSKDCPCGKYEEV